MTLVFLAVIIPPVHTDPLRDPLMKYLQCKQWGTKPRHNISVSLYFILVDICSCVTVSGDSENDYTAFNCVYYTLMAPCHR